MKVFITEGGVQHWINRIGEYHRKDGPSTIYPNGKQCWHLHGKLHRKDGPAVVDPNNGTELWYLRGNLHRDDGPAVIRSDGTREWYYRTVRTRSAKHFQTLSKFTDEQMTILLLKYGEIK